MAQTSQAFWRRWWIVLPVFLSGWAGSGCANNDPRLVPVVGRAFLDGRPLTFGTVSFRPDGSQGNTSLHHPTGVIDAEGNYRLYTARREGAPPGWYKVLVFAEKNLTAGKGVHPGVPEWLTHVKFTQVEATPLVVEVVEQPVPEAYDLHLTK
jgi:hypothetical protein